MRRQWGADVGELYRVPYMAWHWHRFARWFYGTVIPASFKPYGCELMIAGVSPLKHAFGFHSHAVSMRAPDFTPNFIKPGGTWGSIGSGAKYSWAPPACVAGRRLAGMAASRSVEDARATASLSA